jgi:Type VI secretion system/phage-baseplate injector OB domain
VSDTYFGKYRGKVAANNDSYGLGRVQVTCPAVLGEGRASWAMPSLPYAGDNVGLFLVPPTGANVWVEFEGGDPDRPIWTGCFWDTGEVPADPAVPTTKVLKTDGLRLEIDDTPGSGGVTLEVSPPVASMTLRMTLSSSSVELSAGTAKVTLGPATVSVNDGALEVL